MIIMNKNWLLLSTSALVLSACGGGSESNSAPTFQQSSYTLAVKEDSSAKITVTASDTNNDALTYSLDNAPANAQATINSANGEITYQPNANFNGTDKFTVAVTDGTAVTSVEVTVNIEAVNDLPALDADQLLVSGGEVKKGQLTAVDVDGDTLTYELVTAPENGQMTIDTNTGEVTYKVNDIVSVADSFVVKVMDGNGGELSKTLNLTTNLATNSDRAYYYYASEHSHLKQAQTLADQLKDDAVNAQVYSSLISGYSNAGFDNITESFLNDDVITSKTALARANMRAASAYIRLGENDKARGYLVTAQQLYTEQLATDGLATLDSAFFPDLADIYQDMGDNVAASQVYSVLDLIMATIPEGTASRRVFFGLNFFIDDLIDEYELTRNESDRLAALEQTERLFKFTPNIGYSTNRNNEKYSSITLVAYDYIIEKFIALNETEKAKQALAQALALYGYVGYDDNYKLDADQYAATTKDEYIWVTPDFAAHMVTLYPDVDIDTLPAIAEGSFWYDFVKGNIIEDANEALTFAKVVASTTDQEAVNLVVANKNDDNLRQHFTELVAFNSNTKGAAILMIDKGRYSAADALAQEALALIQTAPYISQNLYQQQFVTGDSSCARIVRLYEELDSLSPEQGYKDKASSTAKVCGDLTLAHYNEEKNDSEGNLEVSLSDTIDSSAVSAKYLYKYGHNDSYNSVVKIATDNLALLTDDDANVLRSIKANHYANLSVEIARGGNFEQALTFYDNAFDEVYALEQNAIVAEIGDVTRNFVNSSRRTASSYMQLLEAIDANQSASNWAETRQLAIAKLTAQLDKVMTLLSSQSEVVKNQEYVPFAAIYTTLGNTERALSIADDESLGELEKASIRGNVAIVLAEKDDFPANIIASVDTDKDGKPNFFAPFATEEMIAASGLELDEDSDNDGIKDEEDPSPLVKDSN